MSNVATESMKNNETTVTEQDNNCNKEENIELQEVWKELGISSKDGTALASLFNNNSASDTGGKLHPILALGIGAGVLFNIGILLSLPPVLRGKGAPYLPTFEKNMRAMFQQLRNEPTFMAQLQKSRLNPTNGTGASVEIIFVDLGSGDGRVVFRAAQEQLFTVCVGYEINPLLHAYAMTQRFIFSLIQRPATRTQFYLRDLWNVSLHNVNVVAVYGLAPIMQELGRKLQRELPQGSYVLSNVFAIPGWQPLHCSADKTYLYRTPDCWKNDQNSPTNASKSG